MKASELRIGNIVGRRDIGNGELRTETIIELLEGKATTSGPIKVICPYDYLLPIPLTEEWLLRFGFENRPYHHYDDTISDDLWLTKDNLWAIHIYDNNFNLFNMDRHEGSRMVSSLVHVHQLQNVMHSLTGEELMITEPHSSADGNRNQNL